MQKETLSELVTLTEKYAVKEGINSTDIPRLELHKFSTPIAPIHSLYQPAVCFVLQGKKTMLVGDQLYSYEPNKYLVVALDLPFSGQVVSASTNEPYLALKLDIDIAMLSGIMLELSSEKLNHNVGSAVYVSQLHDELLSAVTRLVRLLDKPKDAPVLAPHVEHEILYWLINGEQGRNLFRIINGDSKIRQITKVINHIKINFKEHFEIKDLLDLASMSQASFFQHFKSVTNMTPIQYQKQLRLQEARRLMFMAHSDISNAGYNVGYDSPSQFSREYSRLFGLPPSKDMAKIRSMSWMEQSFI